jgi:hypothetical protein
MLATGSVVLLVAAFGAAAWLAGYVAYRLLHGQR